MMENSSSFRFLERHNQTYEGLDRWENEGGTIASIYKKSVTKIPQHSEYRKHLFYETQDFQNKPSIKA